MANRDEELVHAEHDLMIAKHNLVVAKSRVDDMEFEVEKCMKKLAGLAHHE